jgi:hypothetical protein
MAAACTAAMLSPTFAATSDWLTGQQLRPYFDRLAKDRNMATRLECKSGTGTDNPQTGAVLFKVQSQANPSKVTWNFNWGESGAFKRSSKSLADKGFSRVSIDGFTRPQSGLAIQCAIWHKK